MIPVADLFAVVIRGGLDLLAVRVRIERDIEGILARMHREPRPGPGRRRPCSRFIVTGPGMLPRAELAHVPRDDEHDRRPARIHSLMDIVTGSFAVMNGGGLDRAGIPR